MKTELTLLNEIERKVAELKARFSGGDDPEIDSKGVYRPWWLAEIRRVLNSRFPDGYMPPGAPYGRRLDTPDGFAWDGIEALGATPEQLAHVKRSIGKYRTMMQTGATPFRHVAAAVDADDNELDGVWTVFPTIYETPEELEVAYRAWIGWMYGVSV